MDRKSILLSADARPTGTHSRQYNVPVASEVAVIIPASNDGSEKKVERDIVLSLKGGGVRRISTVHKDYDSLHYVLLFPYGDYGFSLNIPYTNNRTVKRESLSICEFYAYRLMMRADSRILMQACGLFQQYVVDMYAKINMARLNWYKSKENKKLLRAE